MHALKALLERAEHIPTQQPTKTSCTPCMSGRAGKYQSLTRQQRRWLKRRQTVEPAIGYLKSDHRMDRCWLKGQLGDALHAVLCAAGDNLRWLLRAMFRLRLKAAFFIRFYAL